MNHLQIDLQYSQAASYRAFLPGAAGMPAAAALTAPFAAGVRNSCYQLLCLEKQAPKLMQPVFLLAGLLKHARASLQLAHGAGKGGLAACRSGRPTQRQLEGAGAGGGEVMCGAYHAAHPLSYTAGYNSCLPGEGLRGFYRGYGRALMRTALLAARV